MTESFNWRCLPASYSCLGYTPHFLYMWVCHSESNVDLAHVAFVTCICLSLYSITSRLLELTPIAVRAILLISFICKYATQWITVFPFYSGSFALWEKCVHFLHSAASQLLKLTPVAVWATQYLYGPLSLQNLVHIGLPYHGRFVFG